MKDNPFKIGIPTILMLLFSLCLIIFSLLSLSTASSDYRLSLKLATRNQAYYDANNSAQSDLYNFSNSKEQFFENTYYIDSNESLYVSVIKTPSGLEITNWKIIYTTTDNYNEHLHVIE